MVALRLIGLATFLLTAFALQACIQINIGGTSPEPTPTPLIPSIPVPSTFTSVSLGPAIVQGMYCWTEYPSGERYMKLAVYNPSDSSLRILAEPYGSFSVISKDVALMDNLRISEGSACEYSLALDRNDEGNEHLSQNYVVEFRGVTLPSPEAEALALVNRYLADLKVRNLDSLRSYVEGNPTTQTLVRLIAWRATIIPLDTSIESCRPRFTFDPHQTDSSFVPTWICQAKSVHTSSHISGDWRAQVTGNLSDGSMRLNLEQPYGNR